ncbi:carbon-nitrogen hydrolase family protein [Lederbergia galactosidilytica]|uniref:Nitrilase n=1 Tax=Lederbergia galactosidilytica TaxID=217031 RepID=A0A177ZU65_9BACI|nr:carbon-nitrogen hydrolase family protein [Lederbergia galactosidilytica]KRG13205.1 nitrilase [Virgibacillus soli]OAK71253.1 nitrilase [Lederbergia galactosidilytica]
MVGKIKIAMGQMLVEAGQLDANLSRACGMIREAAEKGSHIIVLPECMDLGWTHPGAKELAEPIPGKSSEILCQAAKDANIYVVVGLTERLDQRIYNSAIIISNEGEIILTHRKINELSFALDLYTIGDKINIVETEFGRIGLAICADLRPEGDPIGHSLGLMGSRLLLSPSAWAVPADHDNEQNPYGQEWIGPYSEIAKKYQMTVVGVSNVGLVEGGEWDGWKCIGRSVAIGPNGKILAQGNYGEKAEELIIIEVPY